MDKVKAKIKRFINQSIDIILLIVIITILYKQDVKSEIIISVCGIGISVSYYMRQQRIENDKIFKELFVLYNEKYDSKFNETLNLINKHSNTSEKVELSQKEIDLIIDYLNMCSEQYLWFKKGRIDNEVWNSWRNGMLNNLNNELILKVINSERKQSISYYGLFEHLEI